MIYPDFGKEFTIFDNYNANITNYASNSFYWKNHGECDSQASSSVGLGCAARIIEENWEMNY